jgi:hypothetical protein
MTRSIIVVAAAIWCWVGGQAVALDAQELQRIEQAEQQRWSAEDLVIRQRVQRQRGNPPADISQRAPEQRRLGEEMQRLWKRRITEIREALRRYCPSEEPPCFLDPPPYLLQQAVLFGLIERSESVAVPPQAGCYGMIDPEGPVTLECYGMGSR